MIAGRTGGTDPQTLGTLLEPLAALEIGSIGAIMSAAPREEDPGYVFLLQDTKAGKQASVEQVNTLLRIAGRDEVHDGGLSEPVLRMQTLVLQKASTTAMLKAMRTIESSLVAGYRQALGRLHGFERDAVQVILHRTMKHEMLLTAHIARRSPDDADEAARLVWPLARYFASEEDRVCTRCHLDRPGRLDALEKHDPETYLCAACHDEVVGDFPPDLQLQVPRWDADTRRDRVLHHAFGRPQKMRAMKEVHAVLAGLEPQTPAKAAARRGQSPPADVARHVQTESVSSDLEIARDGAAADELAYTDLLFDFRSVRRSW